MSKYKRVALMGMVLVNMMTLPSWSEKHTQPANANKPAEHCTMPKPTEQHAWLQQFVGEWIAETQAI
jgi:hypothetical protein